MALARRRLGMQAIIELEWLVLAGQSYARAAAGLTQIPRPASKLSCGWNPHWAQNHD